MKWEIGRTKVDRKRCVVGVRLRRALALTSVALKFEMVFEVGSLDAPLTGSNLPAWGDH